MKRFYLIETTDNEYRSSYKRICRSLEEAIQEVPNFADWWSPKGTCTICEVDEKFTVYKTYKYVEGKQKEVWERKKRK